MSRQNWLTIFFCDTPKKDLTKIAERCNNHLNATGADKTTKGHIVGDRAVAGFKADSKSPTIFMYRQWGGSNQSQIFAEALEAAKPRWHDDSYGTRIMISQMVGDDWAGELGYGIYAGGTAHGADYNHILVANFETQKVEVCENDNSDNILAEIEFEDFIENHSVLVPNATLELDQRKHEEFLAKYPTLA